VWLLNFVFALGKSVMIEVWDPQVTRSHVGKAVCLRHPSPHRNWDSKLVFATSWSQAFLGIPIPCTLHGLVDAASGILGMPMATLNVIIPPGMKPGQEIQAQSPDGTLVPCRMCECAWFDECSWFGRPVTK